MNGAASKKAGPGSEDLQRGLCPDTLQPSLRARGWLHLCSLLPCICGVAFISGLLSSREVRDRHGEEQLCSQDRRTQGSRKEEAGE